MTKQVTVEEFKSTIDVVIEGVREGVTVEIIEDGETLATLQPQTGRTHRGIRYPFRDLEITPLEKPLPFDPVDLLIEERDAERSGKRHGL
ncbi:MAG TPA: hypothetical protein VFO89_08945 [Thermoanaerobaculia bacterium]|nr:hypothetical protein [Thermoanaerobaculia bacterium]